LKTSDFDYDLPQKYIAQSPVEPRDSSRLMVYSRQDDALQHKHFHHLGQLLTPGDTLVINQTRVIPGRLFGHKIPTGGKVEFLLLRQTGPRTWETMVGGKGLRPGKQVQLEDGPQAEILREKEGPVRLVRFSAPIEPYIEEAGKMPLPPYIHKTLQDPERYQTVYSKTVGSAAAPTAGLHFTPRLIAELKDREVKFVEVTLHVGLDTFVPVHEENPQDHSIHTEWCRLSPKAAEQINQTRQAGKRVIAVGTTSVRVLETAARNHPQAGFVAPFEGKTDLYILPGFDFQVVDALITNFHLPESTLLMLVSAFVGREKILDLYSIAKQKGYRFYSFGDAMLLE
jgi:S-adenosylmethionine:tRNA ribosyltransferase-isomerase